MRALIALVLLPPVPGDVVRGFAYAGDPFAAGHHRGVDIGAAPGTVVKAACSGRVTFAGRAGANGRVVTMRCGRWSVTHLPLAAVATRAGAAIPAGAPIGTAARTSAHAGLHLGVRRATDPHGYIDPGPLLRAPPRPAPPVAPRAITRRPASRPSRPAPLPVAPAPRPAATPQGSSPLAPWPAWAGLALLLAGATGAGRARARRRRRASMPHAAAAPVP